MAARRTTPAAATEPGDDASEAPTITLAMTTPNMALCMRAGASPAGQAPDPLSLHERLIEFVRALARDAAQADEAASRTRTEFAKAKEPHR